MKHFLLKGWAGSGPLPLLVGKDYHYLVRVRRLTQGALLPVCTEQGLEGLCQVAKLGADSLTLTWKETFDPASSSTSINQNHLPEITLYPFLLKSGKMEDVIRQACECGVRVIQPLSGEHCVGRLEGKIEIQKKVDRWNSIAREACQQSGRSWVVTVLAPVTPKDLPETLETGHILLFFHEQPLAKASLHGYLACKPSHVGLIVGPEGGISPNEVKLFLHRGYSPAHMGPGVLRAETASIAALGAVNVILQESDSWTIPK